VREQVEAESREKVLGRLGEGAARLREKLGESLGSIETFAAPIEQATTSSLEAFKAYDLGRQRHFGGQYFEAIPLYRRAVELDPNFAIAYAALGITYGTAREYELAAQSSQRAFDLRERVSERERFYIAARYYMDVLDDGDKAIEVLELWKQTYPRDFVPRTNLAARYCAIGQHERALVEAREGLRLNPDAAWPTPASLTAPFSWADTRTPGPPSIKPGRGSWILPTAATCCMGLPSWRETPRPCRSRSTASRERRPKRECSRCSP
jgi:tetratricopeptide (TPR) repeat protein